MHEVTGSKDGTHVCRGASENSKGKTKTTTQVSSQYVIDPLSFQSQCRSHYCHTSLASHMSSLSDNRLVNTDFCFCLKQNPSIEPMMRSKLVHNFIYRIQVRIGGGFLQNEKVEVEVELGDTRRHERANCHMNNKITPHPEVQNRAKFIHHPSSASFETC